MALREQHESRIFPTSVTATYSSTGGNLLPNRTYEILSPYCGLAVAATGTTNGSSVVQQTYTATATQKWTLTNLGNNVVELTNPFSPAQGHQWLLDLSTLIAQLAVGYAINSFNLR